MTIAIGLLARDGIVVAADSQVTIGSGKVSQGKMRAGFNTDGDANTGSCVIASAGLVGYTDSCAGLLTRTFSADKGRGGAKLKEAFEANLKKFNRDHVLPFAKYPAEDRPYVEFIIATERNHQLALWHTTHTVVSDGAPYAAIGCATQHALAILKNLYRLPMLDLWQSVLLAAYVLFQVKESDIYCGGHTDIYYIRNDRFGVINRRLTDRVDAALSEYGAVIEANTFRAVVGGAPSTRASEASKVRMLFKRFVRELSGG